MKSRFAGLPLAALVAIVCVFSTAFADGTELYRTYTLTWTPPTQNTDGSPLTDLMGYYIYAGISPDSLVPWFFAPFGTSSFELTYLQVGTYYFGMTAVTYDGEESVMAGPVNTGGL